MKRCWRTGLGLLLAAGLGSSACGQDEDLGTTDAGSGGSSGAGGSGGASGDSGQAGDAGSAGSTAGTGGAAGALPDASTDATAGAAGQPADGGDAMAQQMPDFDLYDVNPSSSLYQTLVSPKDYAGQVSAWYFGHAT
jgi:hypothetical protein